MVKIYPLQTSISGNLDEDIKEYFSEINAKLITRTGNIIENLEISGLGGILHVQNNYPYRVYNKTGKFLGFCSNQINLIGFDESSQNFKDINLKLENRLGKYFIE